MDINDKLIGSLFVTLDINKYYNKFYDNLEI